MDPSSLSVGLEFVLFIVVWFLDVVFFFLGNIFSQSLSLVPAEHRVNTTGYMITAADHVLHDLKHDDEFHVLKLLSRLPDLSPVERTRSVAEQEIPITDV